jgi:hypothetical protein
MDELLVCDFEFLLLNCFSHLLLFYFVIGCACCVNVQLHLATQCVRWQERQTRGLVASDFDLLPPDIARLIR